MRNAFPLALALPVCLAALGSPARAQESDDVASPWYVELGLGAAEALDQDAFGGTMSFEHGYTVSALLGRDLLGAAEDDRWGLALEAEGVYAGFDVDGDGLLEANSSSGRKGKFGAALVNGVIDCSISRSIDAYAGAGVGAAFGMDFSTFNDAPSANSFGIEDESVVAYQAKLGLRYRLGKRRNFCWSLGYRYLATGDMDFRDSFLDRTFSMPYELSVLEMSVRWEL